MIGTFVRFNIVYFKLMWEKNRLYFLHRLLLILSEVGFTILVVVFPKLFIDTIVENKFINKALLLVTGYLLIVTFKIILGIILKVNIAISESDVKNEFQQNVIKKLFMLDVVYFANASQNDKISRAMNFANGTGEQLIHNFFTISTTILSLLNVIYILKTLNIWISFILLAVISINFVANKLKDVAIHKVKQTLSRHQRKMSYIYGLMADRAIVKELKLNNALEFTLKKFQEIYRDNNLLRIRLMKKNLFYRILTAITSLVYTFFLYCFIGKDLLNEIITLGSFTMYFAAATNVNMYFKRIDNNISTIRQATLQAFDYFEFMDIEPECTTNSEKFKLEPLAPLIEFESVYFKYHGSDEWVLEDVSFMITPHTKTIIAGENGAGKSTIVKLMMGLYHPDRGIIKINGKSLESYDPESLFDGIAAVFQDHHEFAFTIAENVLLDTYTEEQEPVVVNALSRVGLLNKVKGLSKGILTPLSKELEDNGTDLSGGERQRLSIARAFAKSSHLLILDEPSSALDAIAEDQLLCQLDALARDKTVVLISHRLVNVKPSDQILFIEKGTVVEYGSHSELVSTNSKYRDMYTLHANKYAHM